MAASKRGPWTVTAVNGVVAGTVLVLVAVLALVVKPPAPPGIAAFAPQASKPITKAPPGQSAQFGNGAGQCGEGQVCAGASPTASASASASAQDGATPSPTALRGALPPGLQCYEWPDGSVTQTFDPQSPPCVSRWDDAKGNGGATWTGVTDKEIRVALPVVSANSTWPTVKPILDFFNTRFQLYGRKIVVVPVTSKQADGTQSGAWNDPSTQRADAAQIKAQKVFASFDFIDPIHTSASTPVFLDALAKARIVSINGGEVTPFDTSESLAKRAPYAWSYYPTIDVVLRNLAAMTCRQLVGKPAVHAPDPALRGTKRKFVIWLPSDENLGGPLPGLSALPSVLKACGAGDVKVVRRPTGRSYAAEQAAAFQQLKQDGVTTVIYYPYGDGPPASALHSAQQVGFRPEWNVIGWSNYNTAFMLNDPPAETAGAFGVGMWNKQPALELEPWAQAVMAAGGTSDVLAMPSGRPFYQELLLLASGIQMAGPNLTPESFAKGLHDTVFPNPGAGRAPFYQATVGFPGSSPIMVADMQAFWLDTRRSGQDVQSSKGVNQSKAFCAIGLGLRWDEDSWPREDRFYQGACR